MLLHADGSGNSFTDSSASGHTITITGSTTQSATQSKFGGKSLSENAGDTSITDSGTYSADFGFGTGDFTIDLWVYMTYQGAQQDFIDARTTTDILEFYSPATSLGVWMPGPVSITGGTIPINTWTHVAVARHSGSVVLFINGTSVASGVSTYDVPSTYIDIGRANFRGYMDEIRVSKGIARYYSTQWDNFTVPSVAYANSNSGFDNMTLVSTSTNALSAPTQGRLMVLQEQLDPTAVANTDWKAYITNDNGTNWNQITLASEGNYSDNVTMYSGAVNYTGTITGMRWKIQTWIKNNMFRGIGHVWN